jgi:hypothetical protein
MFDLIRDLQLLEPDRQQDIQADTLSVQEHRLKIEVGMEFVDLLYFPKLLPFLSLKREGTHAFLLSRTWFKCLNFITHGRLRTVGFCNVRRNR